LMPFNLTRHALIIELANNLASWDTVCMQERYPITATILLYNIATFM
jgi:hypothetical protein